MDRRDSSNSKDSIRFSPHKTNVNWTKQSKTITRGLWKLTGRKQVNNHFEKSCWILGWNLWHSCQELTVLTSQLLYTPQLCWGNSAPTVRPTMKARSPNTALSQVHTWCAVIKTANLGGHKRGKLTALSLKSWLMWGVQQTDGLAKNLLGDSGDERAHWRSRSAHHLPLRDWEVTCTQGETRLPLQISAFEPWFWH